MKNKNPVRVKDLIKKLKSADQDAYVVVNDYDGGSHDFRLVTCIRSQTLSVMPKWIKDCFRNKK